jgi:hypothetical protein
MVVVANVPHQRPAPLRVRTQPGRDRADRCRRLGSTVWFFRSSILFLCFVCEALEPGEKILR